MTDLSVASTARGVIFERDILPLLFPEDQPEDSAPTFVLLTGQPGAGAARAIGRLRDEHNDDFAVLNADELRALHPQFVQATASGSVEAARQVSEATAEWLRAGMAFAREHRRSLLLEGNFATPSTVLALAQRFAGEGFRTRVVVVGVRRAESLLATLSQYLSAVQAGRPARFVSREVHDRGFEGTRTLTAALEDSTAVDRVTVLDRAGATKFDAEADGTDHPFQGAGAALVAAQSEQLWSLGSVQWMSELRRVTEFAATLRKVPRAVTEVLIDLHETALRQIIPELRVPAGSKVVAAQEHRSASELVALRRSLIVERPVDAAAPVVAPTGPERGGLSR